MSVFIALLFLVLFFTLEILYFKIANKYNIIDKPNSRSSHTQITIRGGGIIFSLALFAGVSYYGLHNAYFLLGLFIISLVSFMDDIDPVANRVRIICHLVAACLLFYQLNIYELPYYWIIISFVFIIGTINAINFMDGINGITGLYGLVTLFTLYYINQYVIWFVDNNYLILSILSLCVFNFFNFRTKAKCFAGDVGSVSLAFIILFHLLQVIVTTHDFKYLLILIVYGLDVVTTIFFRICRRENIFDAHRTHFYQFLANEKGVPHLLVAALYGVIQLFINYILISYLQLSITNLIVAITMITIVFISIRWYFEGSKRLFKFQANN
jgi:UDP-GlcNAc:undecaprenyl-phosphate/decaprenyl-phosphate GlcNAc-1-phosphate transferase